MAFGSGAVGLGGASRADVVLRADTGQFRKDITEAQQLYQRTTGQMSDAALRMQIAQEKLDRAIGRYGAESRQAKEATVRYRAEMRALEQQTERTERETRQAERSLSRLSRGAVAGSGVFHGLGRSIAFASSSFLGGAGLVYGLRSVVQAGREAEASAGRVEVAVRNVGLEYSKYRDQINQTITAQSKLSAFDDEDLADSFAQLLVRTRDVSEALKLNALAADVARGRQISLEAATQLVIKASIGQAGQLRRVGLDVKNTATAQELLNKLTVAYGGQARKYASSAAGAQEALSVAIENTEENLAQGLLPVVERYSRQLTDWLNDSENQKRLQHDVNMAIQAGTGIVTGLAAALRVVGKVAEPVVDALGGIEKAAQLALIVGIATKARKAALGFLPLQAASRATATKGVEDAAVFGRAWDAATRPRIMVVTTTGGGGGTTTTGGRPPTTTRPPSMGSRGIGGLLRGAGRFVGAIAGFAVSWELLAAIVAAELAHNRFDDNRITPAMLRDPDIRLFIRQKFGASALAKLDNQVLGKGSPVGTPGGDRPVAGEGPRTGRMSTSGRMDARGGRAAGAPARTQQDYLLDLRRAATDTRRLAVLRPHLAYVQGAIARLEADKTLSGKQKQRLMDLYDERDKTQADIDQIIEKREAASDTAAEEAEKRRAARRKAAADRARAWAARQRDIDKQVAATEAALPRNTKYANTSKEFSRYGVSPAEAARRAKAAVGDEDRPLTLGDLRRLQTEWLRGLQGITNQFASNIAPDQTATNTWRTAKLTEQLVAGVDRLSRSVQHPGAKYARNELMLGFGDVGGV